MYFQLLSHNANDLLVPLKVQEVIKANLQRCDLVKSQMDESRQNATEVFEHKDRVREILEKYVNVAQKRQVKKRDQGRY